MNRAPRWPDFFVVGAPKAGTTTLYRYFQQIDEIYVPHRQEPRYFSPETATRAGLRRVDSEAEYLDLFRNAGDRQLIGEISPIYLRSPEAPRLIKAAAPQAKIIISLRDPVSRAFSHYWMRWRLGQERRSFLEALDDFSAHRDRDSLFVTSLLESGFYFQQVNHYLQAFGQQNVHIMIFEEFVKEPEQSIVEVCDFLGITTHAPDIRDSRHNAYFRPRNKLALGIVRNQTIRKLARLFVPKPAGDWFVRKVLGKEDSKPVLGQQEQRMLADIYASDVASLLSLLNRDLPWPIAESLSEAAIE